ncbi:hypothetical protein D9R21_05325 [Spiroplasma endosymbiont of Megaselia nigra]|nr:hypothetical protein D9R21_05325 [Spiroplasma endosymbiont of Megaselia nigra]
MFIYIFISFNYIFYYFFLFSCNLQNVCGILQKKDISDIIIHSDHGFQYTSKIYNNKCISNGIRISMGKNYHCADNIVIEIFHSLLKKATIHNNI